MTEKYLLRKAVRELSTDNVYRRPRHPFMSPARPGARLDSVLRPEQGRRPARPTRQHERGRDAAGTGEPSRAHWVASIEKIAPGFLVRAQVFIIN